MASAPQILLVIPAYNEQECIADASAAARVGHRRMLVITNLGEPERLAAMVSK